jgi:hypothetical protein
MDTTQIVKTRCPPAENEDRFGLVEKWREAVVKQLLTPAPDMAAVAWKRAKLAGRGFTHLPITRERAEQVIGDDLAFLTAHPARTKKGDRHEAPSPTPTPKA